MTDQVRWFGRSAPLRVKARPFSHERRHSHGGYSHHQGILGIVRRVAEEPVLSAMVELSSLVLDRVSYELLDGLMPGDDVRRGQVRQTGLASRW